MPEAQSYFMWLSFVIYTSFLSFFFFPGKFKSLNERELVAKSPRGTLWNKLRSRSVFFFNGIPFFLRENATLYKGNQKIFLFGKNFWPKTILWKFFLLKNCAPLNISQAWFASILCTPSSSDLWWFYKVQFKQWSGQEIFKKRCMPKYKNCIFF